MQLVKPDKRQDKRPRVLLIPPSALPIPAVRGGAVETLITHLIRENERQGRLDLICASVMDPDAKAAAADWKKHPHDVHHPPPGASPLLADGFCGAVFRCGRPL